MSRFATLEDMLLSKWRSPLSLLTIAIIILMVDQATKALVLRYLPYQQPWNPITPLYPIVTLTHVTNTGAAFGLFPDGGLIFTVIALTVIAAILAYYRYLPQHPGFVRLSLGLQLGGALGNLIDRLRFGRVIDFIDFHFWPVFNVADSSIVIGVAILAYYLVFVADKQTPRDEKAQIESA
jgi:signal peptidase II